MFGNFLVMGTMPDGRHAGGSLSLTGTIFKPFGCYLAPGMKKNPALVVCNHAIESLQHAGRLDCFRRPVKVSATIAAFVPDRLIPIQGQSSKSRTGQGKFGCHFPKNTGVLCTMIRAKLMFANHVLPDCCRQQEEESSNSPDAGGFG
jgi:hypothetical protein